LLLFPSFFLLLSGLPPKIGSYFSLEEREEVDGIHKSEREKCCISQIAGGAGEGRKSGKADFLAEK
jgi:hypothetical protein